MLNCQRTKNRIFEKIVSLLLAQVFLFTSFAYPADIKDISNLYIPAKSSLRKPLESNDKYRREAACFDMIVTQDYEYGDPNEVINQLNLKAGDRVIDLGCGPGVIATSIANTNKHVFVIGIDKVKGNVILAEEVASYSNHSDVKTAIETKDMLDMEMLLFRLREKIQKEGLHFEKSRHPNLEFIQMSIVHMDFRDNSFDKAVFRDVYSFIHSEKEKSGAIDEILRIMKEGSLIYVRPRLNASVEEANQPWEEFRKRAEARGIEVKRYPAREEETLEKEKGAILIKVVKKQKISHASSVEPGIATAGALASNNETGEEQLGDEDNNSRVIVVKSRDELVSGQTVASNAALRQLNRLVNANLKRLREALLKSQGDFDIPLAKDSDIGNHWMIEYMENDPGCYVGYGDGLLIGAMNKTFSHELITKMLPLMISAANKILGEYGGGAVRIDGDEVGIALPSYLTPEEVNNIRLELQLTLAKFLTGRYGFVKINGVTDENKKEVNMKLSTEWPITGITGIYEDAHGFFLVYDRKLGLDNSALSGFNLKIEGRPISIPSPRFNFGIVRGTRGISDIHTRYGDSIRHAQYVKNIAKENGLNGATSKILGKLDRFDKVKEGSPGFKPLSQSERKKIADTYTKKAGVKLFFDQIEGYYPIVKREYLYYVIRQMKSAGVGTTVLIRGPPEEIYVVTKANGHNIYLLKLEFLYKPRGEFKKRVEEAIEKGKFTRDSLRQRWPEHSEWSEWLGFKVIGELGGKSPDHVKGSRVIRNEVKALNTGFKKNDIKKALAELNEENLKVSTDKIAEKVQQVIRPEADTDVMIIAGVVKIHPKVAKGKYIRIVDNLTKIAEPAQGLMTEKGNIVTVYDPKERRTFENKSARFRGKESSKFRPILFETYSKPALTDDDLATYISLTKILVDKIIALQKDGLLISEGAESRIIKAMIKVLEIPDKGQGTGEKDEGALLIDIINDIQKESRISHIREYEHRFPKRIGSLKNLVLEARGLLIGFNDAEMNAINKVFNIIGTLKETGVLEVEGTSTQYKASSQSL